MRVGGSEPILWEKGSLSRQKCRPRIQKEYRSGYNPIPSGGKVQRKCGKTHHFPPTSGNSRSFFCHGSFMTTDMTYNQNTDMHNIVNIHRIAHGAAKLRKAIYALGGGNLLIIRYLHLFIRVLRHDNGAIPVFFRSCLKFFLRTFETASYLQTILYLLL